MDESSPKTPAGRKPTRGESERRERQAAQLRENLRKRKQQARVREGESDGAGGTPGDDPPVTPNETTGTA